MQWLFCEVWRRSSAFLRTVSCEDCAQTLKLNVRIQYNNNKEKKIHSCFYTSDQSLLFYAALNFVGILMLYSL